MSKKLDNQEVRKYLAAFADGELDIEQNIELLEHMKMDANSAARVEHQQQLRELVGKVMQDTPPAPDELRAAINKILDEAPSMDMGDDEQNAPEPVIGRIAPNWVVNVASIAAVVAFAVGVMYFVNHRVNETSPISPNVAEYQIVSNDRADRMAKRHDDCAKAVEKLHRFLDGPESLKEIPAYVSKKLGSDVYQSLDLSAVGYKFVRAGDCRLPCNKAAHLIYKAKAAAGNERTLSLWIAPDYGNLDIDVDKMYEVRGPESVHPIIVWRHKGAIYYLVGDVMPDMKQAYTTLASAR